MALNGPEAIDTALETIEAVERLRVRVALPGHGPVPADPARSLAAARSRLERMRADPERAGRHACRRILAFALMIHDGLPVEEAPTYVSTRPWLIAHARSVFGTTPAELAQDLLAEMRRTGAIQERAGRLMAGAPYRPAPDWRPVRRYPRDWRRGGGADGYSAAPSR